MKRKVYFVCVTQYGTREPSRCGHRHETHRSAERCDARLAHLTRGPKPLGKKTWVEKVRT